ncbi:MAG: hypothetical protein M3P06_18000 [Acidobacteriota bacterium]|nr:hypothetical protein [Acidobacteriota bacterium]
MRDVFGRRTALLLSLLTTLSLGLPARSVAAAEIRRAAEPVAGRYVVVLSPMTADVSSVATQLADQYGGKVLAVWKHALKGFWVAMPPANAERLAADTRVMRMEEDAVMRKSGEGVQSTGKDNPPYQDRENWTWLNSTDPLWHLTRISHREQIPAVMEYRYRHDGSGVKLYVVDTGAWTNHQEFVGQSIDSGYNAGQFPTKHEYLGRFVHPSPIRPDTSPATSPCAVDNAFPDDGRISHGTACAGVAVGEWTGVAKGATLVPVIGISCLASNSSATAAIYIGAFDWILGQITDDPGDPSDPYQDPATQPAVVSASIFQFTENTASCQPGNQNCLTMPDLDVLEEVVHTITKQGVPVIVSANNQNGDACRTTPARLSARGGFTIGAARERTHVISVGATTWARPATPTSPAVPGDLRWINPLTVAQSANFGQCVDLWAPGEDIAVPEPRRDLQVFFTASYRAQAASGSSFSAPMVAGVVARMMEEDPTLYATKTETAEKVRKRLLANATSIESANLGPGSPNGLLFLGYAGTFTEDITPSKTVLAGTPVVLQAPLVGSGDFSYQWLDRNGEIPGGTNATYEIPAPTVATHGAGQDYWLRATRTKTPGVGTSVMSHPIRIRASTVVITEQPASFWPKTAADQAVLAAGVQSTEPYAVQWMTMDSYDEQATVASFPSPSGSTTGVETLPSPVPGVYRLAIRPASCSDPSCIVYSETARVAKWEPVPAPQLSIGQIPVNPAIEYKIDVYRGAAGCTPTTAVDDTCKLRSAIAVSNHDVDYKNMGIKYSWDWIPDFGTAWQPLFFVQAFVFPNGGDASNELAFHDSAIWPIRPGTYSVRPGNAWTSTQSSVVRIASFCSFDFYGRAIPSDDLWLPFQDLEQRTFVNPEGGLCLATQLRDRLIRRLDLSSHWSLNSPACGAPPVGTFSSIQVPAGAPSVVTFTARDSVSGCERTLDFKLTSNGTPPKRLVLLAGECQLSQAPVVLKKQNGQVTLRAVIQPGGNFTLPADLARDSVFVWSKDGNIVQEMLGSDGGAKYTHTVNYLDQKEIVLTVRPPGIEYAPATMIIRIAPLNVPCVQCTTSCRVHSVRHNGVAKSFHAFQPGEAGLLGAPEENPAYTYEWHRLPDGGTDEVIGSTGSINVTMSEAARYWVATNGEDSDLLTTVPESMASSEVTITPDYQVVTTADAATVQVAFALADANTRYQWRRGGTYDHDTPVIGTGASLTLAGLPDDTVVWCLVLHTEENDPLTGDDDIVVSHYSPFATIIVNCSPAFEGWISVTPQRVARNQDATLQLSTSGAKLPSYSWYRRMPDDTLANAGASAVLRTTVTEPATQFGAIVTDVCGNSAGLPEKTVFLCVPTIDEQPVEHQIVKQGDPVTVSIAATPAISGQPLTIAWHRSGNSNTVLGNGPSFSPVLTAGTTETYYAIASAPCADSANATVYSHQATIEVCAPPVITGLSSDTNITHLESTTIVVVATGNELTYQWYKGVSGDTANPLNGWTDDSNEFTPSQTTSYWCRVTSRGVCTIDSGTITVHVCNPPSIVAQPQSTTIFANGTATLSVTVDDNDNTDPLTYQWQRLAGFEWQNVANATSTTFTTPSLTTETTYRLQIDVGDCHIASEPATVSICALAEVIQASPAETLVTVGQSTTLQLTISSYYAPTIHWYEGESGVKTTPAGSGASIAVSPQTTKSYWAEIESGGCVSRTTNYTVRVCKPSIVSQPAAASIASGQSATLSVATTTLAGQTFQWYTGTAGNTASPVLGQTSANITVSPTTTTSYWVRVTGTCSTSVDSVAATVSVCNPPAITALAPNRSIQQGNSTTLDVSATGSTLTYKWYVGTSGTTTTPVANGTNPSISVSPGATTSYWVQIKSAGLCVTNSSTITVDVCTTPAITAQPQAQTIRTGQSATLSVTTSAVGATYQWYQGAPGTTTTSLGTTASISVSPANDTAYWVRVTRGVCSVDSTGATVTVCKLTATVANVNAASGQNATLTASVSNARSTLTHWWYRGNSGDTTNLVNAGTLPQITVSRTASTNYWVRVTDNTCTIDSATATLNICVPTITAQPQSLVVTSGQTTTLSVTATGSPLTYQWYIGDSGVTTSPIAGATSSSYTTPAMSTLTKYWVRVSGCGNVNSAAATVTVCVPPSITATPTKSGGQYATNTGTLAVTAAGTSLSYQWYKGQPGDTTRPMSGGTTATHSFTLSVSEYYWVRVTGSCGSVDSTAVLYSVTPAITTQPQNASVPSGTRVPLNVTATGNFLTYQWYLGTGSSTPISGATSASYLTAPVTANTTYWVKVSSGTTSVNSSQITATICAGPSVSFTKTSQGSHSWKLTISITNPEDLGLVKYQWYMGTPGDVSQSTAQGGITWTNYKYVYNLTESQTWWVRVWYDDDSCFTDTGAQTIY